MQSVNEIVFVARRGRATERIVKTGERNASVAQVLDGLTETDTIILHPSDRVAEGVRVRDRDS